jgi:hypothetical protein
MTENDSLRTINTFMLPHELQTVEECDRYRVLCERKRDFMLKMKPPRYTLVVGAWNARISETLHRRAVLAGTFEI